MSHFSTQINPVASNPAPVITNNYGLSQAFRFNRVSLALFLI